MKKILLGLILLASSPAFAEPFKDFGLEFEPPSGWTRQAGAVYWSIPAPTGHGIEAMGISEARNQTRESWLKAFQSALGSKYGLQALTDSTVGGVACKCAHFLGKEQGKETVLLVYLVERSEGGKPKVVCFAFSDDPPLDTGFQANVDKAIAKVHWLGG